MPITFFRDARATSSSCPGLSRASTFLVRQQRSWMAGTSPAMTMWKHLRTSSPKSYAIALHRLRPLLHVQMRGQRSSDVVGPGDGVVIDQRCRGQNLARLPADAVRTRDDMRQMQRGAADLADAQGKCQAIAEQRWF